MGGGLPGGWRRALNFVLAAAALVGGVAGGLGGARAQAQTQSGAIVRWTTNYYTVTGATPLEIRRSMSNARPWKRQMGADATTTWRVEWRYGTVSTGDGCRPDGVSTTTTIVTTLPRYVPPKGIEPEVTERWSRYFGSLARHEAQHAALGVAAAAEIRSQLASLGVRRSCPDLQRDMTAAGNAVVERFRREERALDERTRHGATDGATFP